MAKDKVNSARYVNISKSSITMWRNFYNDGFNFLANYKFLTDSYVLDFFSEDLWQSIPPLWGEALQSFSPQQLSALLHPPNGQSSQSNRIGAVLPLSLLAFRSAAFACTLPREAVSSPSVFFEYMEHCCPTSNWLTDAENVPFKAPPSSHVNSTHSPTNHICSVLSQTSNVGPEVQMNEFCSKSKTPLHIYGSSAANEGIHSRALAEVNSSTEVLPIDGTTNLCVCCITSDVSLLTEDNLIISPSKVNCAAESLINDCTPNVCDKFGNKCMKLNLGTVGNCLTSNSELLYGSKQEVGCNFSRNNESHESRSAFPHCNSNHKNNGIKNSDTESFFEESKSKDVTKNKQDGSHCLISDSNTSGVCSQQKKTFLTELSFQTCSERRSLSNDDKMDLRRKLGWTCNKNLDVEPAWPATDVDSIVWGASDSELTKGGQHRLLSHVFRRHVKPKKQHEVARLGLIAAFASAATRCDVTSDVGSGCGHLARLMAYGHRLRVVCIDKEEEFVKGARQFDDQLEKSMSKMKLRHASRGPLNEDQQLQQGEDDQYQLPAGPRHAACLLRLGGDVQTFAQTVLSLWPDLPTTNASLLPATQSRTQAAGFGIKFDIDDHLKCQQSETVDECYTSGLHERARRFGLTGLHTCGDLAATLLDVFLRTPHCRYLASVACCYMKLTTTPESSQEMTPPGYPLSQHCRRQQPHQTVSYAARELACHAIEAYRDRLLLGADNLKVHCYRAALEAIIVKHWPHHKRAGLRSVKNAHTKPFQVYAVSAVSVLEDGRLQLPDAELNSPETLDRLSRWRQVVVFYTLRLLLAPVVETVLLLDRSFYLYEQGVDSVLVPTFDPKLSPRNVVLLAIKND